MGIRFTPIAKELRDEGANGTAKKTFILLQRGVEEVH